MKSSELHRKAMKAGWKLLYQDASSHCFYEKNGKIVCIPFHGSKEMPTGTCMKILKELGLK